MRATKLRTKLQREYTAIAREEGNTTDSYPPECETTLSISVRVFLAVEQSTNVDHSAETHDSAYFLGGSYAQTDTRTAPESLGVNDFAFSSRLGIQSLF